MLCMIRAATLGFSVNFVHKKTPRGMLPVNSNHATLRLDNLEYSTIINIDFYIIVVA